MRRGTDESAIESMAEAAIPTTVDLQKDKKTAQKHKKNSKEKENKLKGQKQK